MILLEAIRIRMLNESNNQDLDRFVVYPAGTLVEAYKTHQFREDYFWGLVYYESNHGSTKGKSERHALVMIPKKSVGWE